MHLISSKIAKRKNLVSKLIVQVLGLIKRIRIYKKTKTTDDNSCDTVTSSDKVNFL